MNNRQKLKYVKAELRNLGLKVKSLKKAKEEITEEITGLTECRDFIENMGKEIQGFSYEGKLKPAKRINGIWIVSETKGTDVTLTKFFELVRGAEKPLRLEIPHILDQPNKMIGDDGKEVSFTKGSLLAIANLHSEKGYKFHFANVSPNGEIAQIQYEIALARLGMGIMPQVSEGYLIVDGQFRKAD